MKLAICTPSRGQVSLGYLDTYDAMHRLCDERGVEFERFDDRTANEIHQARNLLLFRVSELGDDDWALWLDNDVAFNPRHAIELLSRDEEIIVRAYPIKPYEDEPPAWSVHPILARKELVWSEDRRLCMASHSGFGCVLMRATAAKKVRDRYGVRGKGGRGRRFIPAFDLLDNEWDTRCGEDSSFCERWCEEMGHALWLAPEGYVRNGNQGGVYLNELARAANIPAGSPLYGLLPPELRR